MKTYTVHEAPNAPADRLERAERLVFVEEGFSWVAALFTPFWLLAHRLWLELIAYIAVATVVQLAVSWAGLAERPAGMLMLALHLVAGFEADALRRWSLRRRGFALVGTVSGRTVEDCERRFFEDWLKAQPLIASDALSHRSAGRQGTGYLGGWSIRGRSG